MSAQSNSLGTIKTTRELSARLALLATALIWGTSLTFAKQAMAVLPPNQILAWRFTIAAPLAALIFFPRVKKITKLDLIPGLIGGTALFFSYSLQTVSIQFTTPGRAAFLNTTYCIIVPFLAAYLFKFKLDKYNIIASFFCLAGVTVIGLAGGDAAANVGEHANTLTVLLGDSIALLSGILFAVYIIMVGRFGSRRDPITLTIIQFAAAAIWAWLVTLCFEPRTLAPVDSYTLINVGYLGIVCTIVALLLQNIGQQHTAPATAAILLSFESIFGVVYPAIFGYESLTLISILGFVLIFISITISETKLNFLWRYFDKSN